ncbi:histone-like nucleoid-structuring protein Lsr2 [Glycomyces sp. NPDC046736]|uniref:Lsr2 dimerization domain-containing protein n=1 Tax=Glycomyces sp. NPDC046736 TaxID=3155615 RepID=UPI0034004FEF
MGPQASNPNDFNDALTTESVVFGLDHNLYQIEMPGDEASILRQTLSEYIKAATRIGSVHSRRNSKRPGELKSWAERSGRPVPAGGCFRDVVGSDDLC